MTSQEEPLPPSGPLFVVISGPSGVGKDALLSKMKEKAGTFHFVVTATTRPQRPGEVSGQDYLFISPEEFQGMIAQGSLLEWAQVYGHLYGVPKKQVRQALSQGKDVIIKADVQGAATLKALAPEGVFIFVAPSSFEELERRLRRRRTESAPALARRLETAKEEMAALPQFDYLVVNQEGRLEEAVARIRAIVTAEKCRVKPRRVEI